MQSGDAYFAPDITDMDVDTTVHGFFGLIMGRQLFTVDHAAVIEQEYREDTYLGAGEADLDWRGAIASKRLSYSVEMVRSKTNSVTTHWLKRSPPEHGTNTSKKFLDLEWLGDVVIGTDIQAPNSLFQSVTCSDDDDRGGDC